MTGAREMTMYCSVCGGPIFEKGAFSDAPDWLCSALLLCKVSQSQDPATPGIISLPAINNGGPYFTIMEATTAKEVTACDVSTQSLFVDPVLPLYIPLHAHCLAIVQEAAVPTIKTSQETLQRLWDVLHARFVSASEGQMVPPTKFYVPSGYYGIHKFQGMEWEPGENPVFNHEAQYFEADPVDVKDLTSTLLQNLELLPTDLVSENEIFASESSSSAAKLPPEIVQTILTRLQPFDGSIKSSDYQIPALYWKYALIQGLVLPWVPKLDASSVEVEDMRAYETAKWDWEKLVRRLGALSFKNGPLDIEKEGYKIAMGLWNRRRIWQLAEDLLVDAS